jgi:hypothetical protein
MIHVGQSMNEAIDRSSVSKVRFRDSCRVKQMEYRRHVL